MTDGYDRIAASRILTDLALAGPLGSPVPESRPLRIRYQATPLRPEPGSHLTTTQHIYLRTRMAPARAEQVTSATHRVQWTDSGGVANVDHFGPSRLGPIVPIAARETTLLLWRHLAGPAMARAVARLSGSDRAILAATTTGVAPLEIFRMGVRSAGRALAHHALIADQTPHGTPAAFALAMRDSGMFLAVATCWFWGLQDDTYRRGMIPAAFTTLPDGTVRYTLGTRILLSRMKQHTIAHVRRVMRHATEQEGLSVPEALRRYHDELDLIFPQYALLPAGQTPRCLAAMTHVIDQARTSILPLLVERYVDTFLSTLSRIDPVAEPDRDGHAVLSLPARH